jgi:hypothetical protein
MQQQRREAMVHYICKATGAMHAVRLHVQLAQSETESIDGRTTQKKVQMQ